MKNYFFAFTLFAVACAHDPEPRVTLPPQASASSSASDAGPDVDVDVATALGAFKAAEALQRDGTKAQARAAFQDVAQKFRYSRWAKEAELRVAQIDDSPEELRQWAHDHRSDERAADILAKLDTVGDVTCRVDADCAVTTKRDCCECCPRRALATSKKWLEWRDTTQCPAERCAGCEESCKPEDGLHAVCAEGKCALVR
ncbi:MAG TPA: hypothetical protein VH054_08010 [Polyangiaceae bacterium]|jgi:hypothetical protein|nr:hypothetical protein [Polyangiaceae bacterium]